MIYYLSFLNTKTFKKNPFKIILRAIILFFLTTFKISIKIKYKFGPKYIEFIFLPLKRHMGGRGLFLFRENLEPLLKYGYKLIKKGDVVIDGGANQGVFTLAFAKKVEKSGKVFAIEPFKYCIDIINNNSRLNNLNNIKTLNYCLFNKEQTMKIDYTKGIGSASIVRKFGNKTKFVRTIVLDNIKKKYNLKKINLIKLDIEGAEIAALNGAKNILKNDKPVISVECEKNDFLKLKSLLEKYNYSPFLFDNNGFLKRVYKLTKKEACLIFINRNKNFSK